MTPMLFQADVKSVKTTNETKVKPQTWQVYNTTMTSKVCCFYGLLVTFKFN